MNRKDPKGRVLRKGEGYRKDGRYEYRFVDLDGKRKTVYASSLKELREAEENIEYANVNQIVYKSTFLFKDYFRAFAETQMVSDSSTDYYYKMIKRLNRFDIAKMRVCDISELTTRTFANEYNERYSDSTVKNDFRRYKNCFAIAVKEGLIRSNPFDFNLTGKLQGKVKEKKPLTDEQFDNLLNLLDCYPKMYGWLRPVFILLRETGLRISELSGLTLDNVDFENRTLQINKQVRKIYPIKEYRVYPPKTKSSSNKIPLTNAAVQALHEMIDRIPHTISCDGIDGFFALNRSGTNFCHSQDYFRSFKTIEKRYNKIHPNDPIELTPHVLRHTAATRFIKQGLSPAVVQRILRHASSDITMEVYTHVNEDDVLNVLKQLCIEV